MFFNRIFRRKYEMSLNRVHDTLRIREGNETLTLRVDADPLRIIAGLNQAQKKLQAIDENTTDAKQREVAKYFAETIFGTEQAKQLMDFYRKDATCVINVCGRYFAERLGKLINAAQKKL